MLEPIAPMDVFERCSNEDLDEIVQYLTKQRLTNALKRSPRYKRYTPDHGKYAEEIADEIRRYGGNTAMNLLRGEGPAYDEVVWRVTRKIKKPKGERRPNRDTKVEALELWILKSIIAEAYGRASEEEKKQLLAEFSKSANKKIDYTPGVPLAGLLAQAGVRVSGFLAYQYAVLVANAVAKQVLGRGLTLAVNASLTRSVGIFAGPIGLAISAIWLAITVTGPAYRVIIPCVVHTAYLRQKLFNRDAMGDIGE